MGVRPAETRIRDAVRRLESEANVWIATASPQGNPHLVPLSLAWTGTQVVAATPESTPTARNIAATGRARASLDDADDVLIIDAKATVTRFEDVDSNMAAWFIDRVGWDPSGQPGGWVMLVLTPETTFAWNGVSELGGRTIMRAGEWLTD